MDESITAAVATDTDRVRPWTITDRANAVLLKLLEQIERDVADCKDPLAVYERLCRAEAARLNV